VKPVSTIYRGLHVWQLPPPGQGLAVLQMLNVLEPYDFRRLGPESAEGWHFFIEAKKLAFADRAKFYADPDFEKLPIDVLISKSYGMAQQKRIDPARAAKNILAGDPKLSRSDTIYLTVVDRDRNCVSLIQSNYMGFGSELFSVEGGFALQNRGCLFSLDERHANRLEPGKRPFHTIIPGMVTRDGKPVLSFGVMGGDMQPQGQVQILINWIEHQMNLQACGDAPRIEHIGSETPTGRRESPPGGTVLVEPGISDAVVKALEAKGHRVVRVRMNNGGFQGIAIDWHKGLLHGASESRKDGAAVGY
jgi:gamma-glutamyltranspeptidase / glutathione hydrolase